MHCKICQCEKPLSTLKMDMPGYIEEFGPDWEIKICNRCWEIITQIAYNLIMSLKES